MPIHHSDRDRFLRHFQLVIVLPVLSAFTLQGCGTADTRAMPAKPTVPARVNLTTVGTATGIYPIEAAPTVPSGAVTFTVDNPGKSERGAQVMRVDTGHDAADTFTALKTVGGGGPMPAWLQWAGGVGVVRPGHHYVFSIELKPGRYYVVDRSFQGKPSDLATIEAQSRLDVTPAAQLASLPLTTGSLVATEHGFTTKDLNAGVNTVLLTNDGTEPHNFALSRILPGKTLDQVKEFASSDDESSPPVDLEHEVVSGTLSAGMKQTLALDLTQGSYALLCFASDLAGGPPHVARGEASEVAIR